MADDRIVIEVTLDDGTVKQGFIDLNNEANKFLKNSKKGSEEAASSFKKVGLTVAGLAAGFVAFKGVQSVLRNLSRGIADAAGEEVSVNRLNTALALTGKFSRESSAQIQALADSIEKSSSFTAESAIESAALIQNLGNLSVKDLGRATKASTELAAALGIELPAAANLIAKASTGNVEVFKRYGISVKNTGDAAKDFAGVLQLIEQRFSGSAAAQTRTYAGALLQLQIAFGDVGKEFGKFIVQSPAILETFKVIREAVLSAIKGIKELGEPDVFKPIIINLAVIGQAFVQTFRDIANIVKVVNEVIIAIIGDTLGVFSKAFAQVGLEAGEAAKAAFDAIGNPEESPTLKFLDMLIERVSATSGSLKEVGADVKNVADEAAVAAEGFIFSFSQVGRVSLDVSQQIKQGFANAASQGIQSFVNALKNGQNALSAFGGAIIGVFGDLAIQIGTTLLAAGIGLSALFELSGPKAIVAGLALIAIGSALKALSGGGAGANANPVTGAVGGEIPVTQAPIGSDIEQRGPTNQISVTVQGDVLDSDDSGLRIVELIREFTDKNGRNEVLA